MKTHEATADLFFNSFFGGSDFGCVKEERKKKQKKKSKKPRREKNGREIVDKD